MLPLRSSHNARIPVIDLFCGAGGLSLGLSAVGFTVEDAVEIDADACASFSQMHGIEISPRNIANVNFERLRDRVEVVVGGPPCQPFSTGGKQRAGADPRDGFPQFLRALREIRPRAFMMENVPGLQSVDEGAYFDKVLVELRALGFTVSWRRVNAADYGVPQKRMRLLVVGLRGERAFQFPPPTHGPLAPIPWAASGLVLRRDKVFGEPNTSVVTFARNPDLRPSPFDGHLFNGGGRPINLAAPSHTVLAAAGGNKTHFIDTLDLVAGYHAHLMRGGAPRVGSLEGGRRITVLESALLQSFPDNASFCGARSSQYTQVGNAVPPKLASAIGRSLAAQIGYAVTSENAASLAT